MKKLLRLVSLFLLSLTVLFGCTTVDPQSTKNENSAIQETETAIDENGSYTSKKDVALYLHTYKKLPHNFITKKEARSLGWNGGGLDKFKYGYSIGGDRFGNYEKKLPTGNRYYECDIDTMHKKSRGAKRIIYSDEGDIYYTEDHYSHFTKLYEGDEN